MNLEGRIKRRLLIEGDPLTEDLDGLSRWPLFDADVPLGDDLVVVELDRAARIAALESKDTANPLAATAVVRRAWNPTVDENALLNASQEVDHG